MKQPNTPRDHIGYPEPGADDADGQLRDVDNVTPGVPEFDELPAWDGLGLPTRENCDLTNPRQAFLWMFTAPPGVVGAPLILGTDYFEHLSYRLWQLGARPDAGPQLLKYRPSSNSMLNRWTAAGTWVGIDEDDAPAPTLGDTVESMSQADQQALGQIILAKLGLDPDAARTEPPTVREMADQLRINPDRLVEVLGDVGIDTGVDDRVSEAIIARVALPLTGGRT